MPDMTQRASPQSGMKEEEGLVHGIKELMSKDPVTVKSSSFSQNPENFLLMQLKKKHIKVLEQPGWSLDLSPVDRLEELKLQKKKILKSEPVSVRLVLIS